VEVTTLVIPGENEDDVGESAKWLSTVDTEIPLHITRFFPRYRYGDKPPTPRETIYSLCGTAKKYLKNVFAGNV
jgi:pyruvate formate lyase activating enzyme